MSTRMLIRNAIIHTEHDLTFIPSKMSTHIYTEQDVYSHAHSKRDHSILECRSLAEYAHFHHSDIRSHTFDVMDTSSLNGLAFHNQNIVKLNYPYHKVRIISKLSLNLAELDATVKGLSLALYWNLRYVSIITYSKCVCGWVKCAIEQLKSIYIKGNSAAPVKRRLAIIRSLQEECNLILHIDLVESPENKADALTSVPANWLRIRTNSRPPRSLGADVRREDVNNVVRNCIKCQSIDPTPIHWSEGELGVDVNWKRLAIYVTHYKGQDYLSIIDARPSLFTIWKELKLNYDMHSKYSLSQEILDVLQGGTLDTRHIADIRAISILDSNDDQSSQNNTSQDNIAKIARKSYGYRWNYRGDK
ncbi:hypothetical protein GJ496_004345 [Pomphorhynchus laevis]|nr:hypothetical protein GJ496_004345 [Pomphorhynchus laevis]